MAMGIRCPDHATPSIRKKLALTLPTSGGRSVDTVRLRTEATEFSFNADAFDLYVLELLRVSRATLPEMNN
jgi:hypothetical protein